MIFHLKRKVAISVVEEEFNIKVIGSESTIESVSSLDCSTVASLAFATKEIPDDSCGIIVVSEQLDFSTLDLSKRSIILARNPRLLFSQIVNYLITSIGFKVLNSESVIHPTALIAPTAVIEAGCIVAEGVRIEPNVVVHAGTSIGARSIIRANSVIGTQGFGFERDMEHDGVPVSFPHLGGVTIDEDVEIGPCTVVARGALSNTLIRKNCKVNSLCRIAHHCDLGENSYIMAGVVLSGGVKVGKGCWIGTNSTVRQKISIGCNAIVGSGAVVVKDIEDNVTVVGNPASKILSKGSS